MKHTNEWFGEPDQSLAALRKRHISQVLELVGNDVHEASRILEVSPVILKRMLKELDLRPTK